MIKDIKKLIIATFTGGLCMWILAGLWHNLILPHVNENIHPHHEGLGIMLIAYFVLAALMAYLYAGMIKSSKQVLDGLKMGFIVGILWVFPHGLAMAAAHGGSITYEIKNTLWHVVEQGLGGIIIAFVFEKQANNK